MRLSIFNRKYAVALGIAMALTSQVSATESKGWYIKPAISLSNLSSQTAISENTGFSELNGNIEAETSSGFAAGIGAGYRYNDKLSAELYWEYRSNDTDTSINGNNQNFSGNYASSIIYLNGYYNFNQSGPWSAYVGAGLGFTQEIDLDIEQNDLERSASGSGDVGFQLMLGTDYKLNDKWLINGEIRYANFSSIDLEGEEFLSGTISGLDYNPISLSIGVKYLF